MPPRKGTSVNMGPKKRTAAGKRTAKYDDATSTGSEDGSAGEISLDESSSTLTDDARAGKAGRRSAAVVKKEEDGRAKKTSSSRRQPSKSKSRTGEYSLSEEDKEEPDLGVRSGDDDGVGGHQAAKKQKTAGRSAPPASVHMASARDAHASDGFNTQLRQIVEDFKRKDSAAEKLIQSLRDEIATLKKATLLKAAPAAAVAAASSAVPAANATAFKREIADLTAKVSQLERRNAELGAELDAAKDAKAKQHKGKSSASRVESQGPAEQIAELFTRLTGCGVQLDETHPSKFRISCVNQYAKRILNFEITFCPDGDIEYNPIDHHMKPPAVLPAFMAEAIYFDESQLPFFVSKVLSVMFHPSPDAGASGASAH